jgi:hypothetical protein
MQKFFDSLVMKIIGKTFVPTLDDGHRSHYECIDRPNVEYIDPENKIWTFKEVVRQHGPLKKSYKTIKEPIVGWWIGKFEKFLQGAYTFKLCLLGPLSWKNDILRTRILI